MKKKKKWERAHQCVVYWTEKWISPPHLSFGGRKSKKEEQKKISLGVVLVCWAADRFITAHASQLGSSLEPSHANTSPRLLGWLPPPLLHWLIALALWLFHPIEFCLTLMIRFVGPGWNVRFHRVHRFPFHPIFFFFFSFLVATPKKVKQSSSFFVNSIISAWLSL